MNKKILRQPGVEPGSAAWKATMITATPLTLMFIQIFNCLVTYFDTDFFTDFKRS